MEMLPRLEAQQQLGTIQSAVAAGGRQLDERGLQGFMNELEKQANGGQRVRKATAVGLAAMGVAVVDEGDEGGD